MIYNLRNILRHVHFEKLFIKRIIYFLENDFGEIIVLRTSRFVIDFFSIDSYVFPLSFFDDKEGFALHDDVVLFHAFR